MNHSNPAPSRIPDAFVILFFVILLATALTYWVPAGQFDVQTVTSTQGDTSISRQQLVPGSFSYAETDAPGAPVFADDGSTGMLNYAFEGLVSGDKWGSAVGVIAFILIVGGAFGIVMKTGAVHNGILALIQRTQKADAVILPLMFVLFSLGGAVFGMGEEAIAFCIVLVPVVIALGYDSITAVLITYVATQIGFATSWMNPFSVAIAQGIADVPLFSGQGFRAVTWAVFTALGLAYTLRYAAQIRRQPQQSLSHASDAHFRQQQQAIKPAFTALDSAILLTFAAGIGWVIWGVTVHQYYIPQIASQFFTVGILCGALACLGKRLTLNGCSEAFQQGAKELLPAALIVGMAKGIILILGGTDAATPSVLNTLLHHASSMMDGAGAMASASLMLVFQSVFNFFVASGSGQAAITMPLMAPLSDLVGVSRQVAILAFQLGDGLSNIVIPTSASLIGCLGVARLDWSIWIRFAWKLFALLFISAMVTMWVAVSTGLQ
ncbi:putative basic amino acid antiporter YfcC [Aestuariibacter halophilus]|uniref:Basic amino acid antiporter YfcC n=1 Tax=Fluctibacter halophilus TaxID=226011 RepID=A0ABS8G7Q9_9ALTE|nr:putative basic amino acid antiporter YfcC [Aestuariibacter halophilus]MCC2616585.1 putative basic amino acid antiporter YfcC [Aestuariibacter halophilus]